ncbi:MAG: bifunctional hydroxymethylpyrimidine kinase/phosphomethylpyrimidine kinase [Acidobacteriales bacterium]|nr:bifunctional hydroxymethylpyrimidine kinase/phosphomethylpyrimidine kinase [Terriglobales bacterium]
MQAPVPIVLTISGFDPGSGAGATADLKTIAAHGCYGVSCLTALTVQNTHGVYRVEPVSPKTVKETLDAIAGDFEVAAVRVGMLGSGEAATSVADALERYRWPNVVLDPILKSSSGAELLAPAGVEVLVNRLFPLAVIVTPNVLEAGALTGSAVGAVEQMSLAAKRLQGMKARNVVITGGHLPENTDLLMLEGGKEHQFTLPKVESGAVHGTGCAFATSIACSLALGRDLAESVRAAKQFVHDAIASAYPIGKGRGPMNHLFRMK